ncbi:MAG: cyclodeaminase [Anaerolineaceae bacterium]|nr:cyclodeaminase [Anaerolineaceae bacterium]
MIVRILIESEIRRCLSMDLAAMEAVAAGFSKLAEGAATVPPILRIDIPEHNGEVDVKTAYLHGLDHFAIKIAAGFFDNYQLGLPTGSGMMLVMSAVTGRAEAFLLDNGYLTDVRTGLAGALAAKYLAREDVETVGVIGSGMQARFQMRALKLVRDYKRIMIFGIVPEDVEKYVVEMSQELGVEVVAASSAEEVVRQSQIVVTTTPAHIPYLQADWLHPGLHITCMGSDSENKQECHAEVFAKVGRICCDRKSQCFRLGELHHALEESVITENADITELGELTSGMKTGRQSDDEVTICDLTGVGVQDTAIALLAYQRALDQNLGTMLGE